MSSPEIFHRPRVVFAPEEKSGSDPHVQPELENPLPLEEEQQAAQALGLAAQSLGRGRKKIDLPTEEIAAEYQRNISVSELAERYGVSTGTIYSRLHDVGLPEHQPKKERIPAFVRRQRQQEEYIESLRETYPTRELTQARMEEVMSTRWDRKTKEGKKRFMEAVTEIRHLKLLYPGLFEEVVRSGVDKLVYGELATYHLEKG